MLSTTLTSATVVCAAAGGVWERWQGLTQHATNFEEIAVAQKRKQLLYIWT